MDKQAAHEFFARHGLDARRVDREVLNAAYRALAKKLHPDRGGSAESMTDLNRAYDALKSALNDGSPAEEQESERREDTQYDDTVGGQTRKENTEPETSEKQRRYRERGPNKAQESEPWRPQGQGGIKRIPTTGVWAALVLIALVVAGLIEQNSGRQAAEQDRTKQLSIEQALGQQEYAEQARNNQGSWQAEVVAWFNRHKRYPSAARMRSEEGTVTVSFKINASGRVLSAQIAKSSGSNILDEAALDMVRRASPVPAPPQQIARSSMTLSVPVNFYLAARER